MKQYFGNHLGLVVNSTDPEYRGRVQVFVPHIMPAIYEGWNEEGQDIEISCVGSNIPEGLTPEIHARLVKILPWAEAASPIIGSSAPGNLFSDITSAVKGAAGAAYNAVAGAANHFFNQGPTSTPVSVEGGDAQGLINKAKGIAQLDYDPNKSESAYNNNDPDKQWGMCARGTTGLDKAAGLIDNNGPSAGFDAASDLATGGTNRTGYNPYTQGTGAKYFQQPFTVDPSTYKPQAGDSVFCGGGGGKGHGHAQKCVGFDKSGEAVWVSDNPQTHFFTENKTASYNNFTVYRLNDQGLAKYTAAIGGKITGQEPPSSNNTQQAADATPAAPNNLARSDGKADAAPQPNLVANPEAGMTGTISGGGTVSNVDTSNMSPAFKAQYDRVLKSMEGSKFDPQTTGKPVIPNDGQTYGITTGSKEEWAHFFTRNASVESSFNPNTAADINGLKKGPLTSFGLYQMGSTQFQRHGGGNIQDPNDNTRAYVKYAEEMYFGNTYRSGGQNVIGGKTSDGKWLGLAAGYGPIRRITNGSPNSNEKQLLAENIANSERQTGNYTGSVAGSALIAAGSTNIVNNTDSNGRTPVINTNDMASGLFAYPNPGAMVWVFFREGNPLFPVYFAASYSSAEWKSAYRGGSPAEAYTNEGGIIGTGTIMKLGPEGGFLSQNRTNLAAPLDNSSSLSFFHQHGSNITMKDGCDFYFSRNNKRDEVDNDRFIITKGYKEEWIEGDASTNTRGNLIVKVGNISAEAIAAMQELSDMSYEMNQTLMDKPKSSGASSKGSTSAAKPEASATTTNSSASTSTPNDTSFNTYTNAGRVGSLNYSNAQAQQNAFKDSIKAAPIQTVPGASTVSKGAYSLGVDIKKPTTEQATNPSGIQRLRDRLNQAR
jgi:hypothetical protein